jgi:predicted ester cyclase
LDLVKWALRRHEHHADTDLEAFQIDLIETPPGVIQQTAPMSLASDALKSWVLAWTTDHAALPQRVTSEYRHHAQNGAELDINGFIEGLQLVLAAFPDMDYRIVHLIGDDSDAAAYVVATGTHMGTYLGIAPTQQSCTFRGAYHCRVEPSTGCISEDWDVFDLLLPALALGGVLGPGEGAG